MKQVFSACCIIILFFAMLLLPKEAFEGAANGLLLWFHTILPTLLPFVIISNLLIYTNSICFISRLFGPMLKKIFHVSENGSFAILTGFLCGYPLGAKVTADLIHTKRISLSEGQYLLSFCNNISPMFIISYIVLQNFKNEQLIFPALIILLIPPVLCSFLFRIYHKPAFLPTADLMKQQNTICVNFQLVDNCIMSAFETITKVGGYIILFSILIEIAKSTPISITVFHTFLLPLLEITNGIPLLLHTYKTDLLRYLTVFFLASFGGFCAVVQTSSVIQQTKLSIVPYIIEKLITALVTSLFAFFYVSFILQ